MGTATDLIQLFHNSADGITAPHPVPEVTAVRAAPNTGKTLNTIAREFETIACVKFNDPGFAFDSSFIKPGVRDELARLHGLRETLAKEGELPPLSVFGHSDPTGNDDYNKQLSGRRARAVYALLTRDTAIWEELFTQPHGGDDWHSFAVVTALQELGFFAKAAGQPGSPLTAATKVFQAEQGLATDGVAGPLTRAKVFRLYMDFLCRDRNDRPYQLDRSSDFLARGADAQGKGDVQGCGEFNPLLMFSQQEAVEFEDDHGLRDKENQPNRRVVVFLFRPGSRVNPERWPCPRAKEGVAACQKRFFTDAAERRRFQEQRRLFEEQQDTFACRFYQFRIAGNSPCERVGTLEDERFDPRGDAEENDQLGLEDLFVENELLQAEPRLNALGFRENAAAPSSELIPIPVPGSTAPPRTINTASIQQKNAAAPTKAKAPAPSHAATGPASDPNLLPAIQRLINGEFADKGETKAGGFKDALMDQLLQEYAKFWRDVDGNPVDTSLPTSGNEAKMPNVATGAGGDSAGKEISELPLWVNIFQNRLMMAPREEFKKKFRDDHRATQRLVQAFFNHFVKTKNGTIHPSLTEFFFHAGKTEKNGQAAVLGGFDGAANWCAAGSSNALFRGLLRKGFRYKAAPGEFEGTSTDYGPVMTKQIDRFKKWTRKMGEDKKLVNVTKQGHGDNRPVKPGDIISVVNGGVLGPLSGHVATVVKEIPGSTADNPNAVSVIYYVSGNAAGAGQGDGSVRAEQVERELIPEGYVYDNVIAFSEPYAVQKQKELEAKNKIQKINAEIGALNKTDPAAAVALATSLGPQLTSLAENLTAAQIEKDRIKKEANEKGIPVDREDTLFLSQGKPNGKFAPIPRASSWVVSITHASKLGAASADGKLTDPDLAGGTPLAELKNAPPDFE